MSDMSPVWKTFLRFKGEFDYNGFYGLIKGFFLSREFDFYENRYKDKGNEIEITWEFEREYDEYHRVDFNVDLHLWDVEFVEVVKGGKPVTVIRCRIDIAVQGKTVWNYASPKIFDESNKSDAFLKKVHDTIVEREIDEHYDVIVLVMQHDLMNEVKNYLGMTAVS